MAFDVHDVASLADVVQCIGYLVLIYGMMLIPSAQGYTSCRLLKCFCSPLYVWSPPGDDYWGITTVCLWILSGHYYCMTIITTVGSLLTIRSPEGLEQGICNRRRKPSERAYKYLKITPELELGILAGFAGYRWSVIWGQYLSTTVKNDPLTVITNGLILGLRQLAVGENQ